MKTIAAAGSLIAFLAVLASGCPKGSYQYKDGCEMDIQPEIAQAVLPSDEKPPADKMPSYQREGVTIVDAPNKGFDDSKADEEKRDADTEGRKAAHVK